MAVCLKCQKNSNDDHIFNCDSCKRSICDTCAGLSAREVQCMQLKNRRLLFLCDECQQGLRQVPVLIKQVSELQKAMSEFKNAPPQQFDNREIKEEIINEILERRKRRKNIIIYNVRESQKTIHVERKEHDKDTVKSILTPIEILTDKIHTMRLGKYDSEKNRPIKVTFEEADDVITVLKNKKKIIASDVRISDDRTIAQREYFNQIRSKLEELKMKGDDSKTIKYVNGKPTIVSIDKNHKKN